MNADDTLESFKNRLVALTGNPPFRFRNTTCAAAERYMQQMTTFEGYTAAEIAAAEEGLKLQFTELFRAYLRHMGKTRGDLFCGSDVAGLDDLSRFRVDAEEIINYGRNECLLQLPHDALVFLTHQGYTFEFIQPHGGFDCPVMNWSEGQDSSRVCTETFALYLDRAVAAQERLNHSYHQSGGYYVTPDENGGRFLNFPARSSGKRATDTPFTLGDE